MENTHSKFDLDSVITAEELNALINKIKRKSFNKVLSMRTDGTTERLNAIIHGVYVSELIGWPFEFCWKTGDKARALHSTGVSLPKFFSKDFIKASYIDDNEFKAKYSVSNTDVPFTITSGGGYAEGHWVGKAFNVVPAAKDLMSEINIIASGRMSHTDRVHLESIVRKVISHEYFDYKLQISDKVSDFIALHYRGGDVIYGSHKHTKHAVGSKSAPLAVIEKYIQDNPEENFLLFGTPVGDTQTDMEYISSKYNSVTLASEYCKPDLHFMVQECFIMSSCKKVASMSGTGVTYFSKLINKNLDIAHLNNLYKGDELYNLLIEGVNNQNYNKLQRSYHAMRALSLNNKDEDILISSIKELDPSNKLTWYFN
jgi:hypothetical protein